MGKIAQGILGPVSGKTATVVGGTWKGIAYVRGKASSIANPRTIKQQTQRLKFALVLSYLQCFIGFIRESFKTSAIKMTAFNACMSHNILHAITGTYPAFDIDFSKLQVAQGPLVGALNPEVTSLTAGEVEFSWEDNSSPNGASTADKVLVLIFNPVKREAQWIIGGNTRIGGSQSITLPSNYAGDEVQCYVAFESVDGSVNSNSSFAGGIIVS